jgi:uncharacterized membrane protein
MRRPSNLDLLMVVLVCVIAVGMAVLDAPISIRLPVGLTAVLVLPGYSASLALFPTDELDGVERAALACSLSIGLIIVVAPLLDRVPGGLHEDMIVGTVSVITVSSAAVAWWRRRRVQVVPRAPGAVRPGRVRWRGATVQWAGIAIAVVAIVSVIVLARDVITEARTSTEFFVLGRDGAARGTAAPVTSGRPTTVTLGITNHDSPMQSYQIIVEAGAERLAATGPISVRFGDTWIGDVDLMVPARGIDQKIRILLLRGSGLEPYRSLTLEVNAAAPLSTIPIDDGVPQPSPAR